MFLLKSGVFSREKQGFSSETDIFAQKLRHFRHKKPGFTRKYREI